MHTWRKKNEVPDSMLPQHDDDTHNLARWLYHLATWLEGAEPPLRLLRAPYPRAWNDHTVDHSIGAKPKVLVAVQGPWRLSARADRKTLTEAYLEYTHTVILVTDGEVVRGR